MALTGDDEENVTIKLEEDQEVSEVKGCYIWLSESGQPNLFDESVKVCRIKRRRCAVYSCNNVLFQNNKTMEPHNITFHKFPKDESTRAIWSKLCNRTDKFSAKSSFICSDHFRNEDYVKTDYGKIKPRLHPGTIPSLKLPKVRSSRAELKLIEHKIIQKELKELKEIKELSQKAEKKPSRVDMVYSPGASDEKELKELSQKAEKKPSRVDMVYSPGASDEKELKELSQKAEKKPSRVDMVYSPGASDEDGLMESFEDENAGLTATTAPHSSSRKKKHAKHCLDTNSSVVIISSSEDEDANKVKARKGKNKQCKEGIRESLLDSLKHNYDNLQRSYKYLKTETDAEIERLNKIIKNKEDEFSRELREVLSVFLKPEKVDSIVKETVW